MLYKASPNLTFTKYNRVPFLEAIKGTSYEPPAALLAFGLKRRWAYRPLWRGLTERFGYDDSFSDARPFLEA